MELPRGLRQTVEGLDGLTVRQVLESVTNLTDAQSKYILENSCVFPHGTIYPMTINQVAGLMDLPAITYANTVMNHEKLFEGSIDYTAAKKSLTAKAILMATILRMGGSAGGKQRTCNENCKKVYRSAYEYIQNEQEKTEPAHEVPAPEQNPAVVFEQLNICMIECLQKMQEIIKQGGGVVAR